MSDVNANIGINIDAGPALAELKNLQRQLATFHANVAKGSASAATAQKNLQTNLLNAINATGKFNAQMGLIRTSTESFTDALENNKLSMSQYFRYAGGATKSFGRLFKSEFDTIGKVAEERVKKMQTQYIKMGRDATGAMKAISVTPTTLNMKDLATQTAIAAQKQAIFNQLIKQGSTSLLNFGKNTQWAGRQLMVGFTVPLTIFGSQAAKTFMDLEAQALRFRRVYGEMFSSAGETEKALADIQELAKGFTKYGVAVVDTMKMAADAAATGKMGAELTAQVSEATRLAVLGGVEQQQSLETTISLTNAFGIAAEDLAGTVNFLNAVENQTVTAIEDLTIAIPKAGPVVKQLGGNVQDLAFFLTAMKEGGINASEGANALKSGLASLINPTKKSAQFLADLGINIKAIVEGNAGNIRETVIDFAQALDTLDPLNRARAIEQLFGKFQFSRLSTLFQNVTKDGTQASRVLDLAGKSVEELAILSERELKAVEDSVGVNFKAAVEDLKVAIAPIGKTFLEAVTPLVKMLGTLFERFNNLGDGTKKFLVIMTTLVGLVGPTLLMTFGLLANGVANIIKLFISLRTGFLKLTGDSKTLGATTNYLTQEQLEAETVAASLNQAHTRLTQQFELEAVAVSALRKAYVDATVAAAKFAAANPGMMAPGKGGKGGKTPKKFAGGATYVPGTGNKDTVASMLTPGEAVIPKDVAQDPRYQPIIDAMVNGKLKGFNEGTTDAGSDSLTKKDFTHVGKSEYRSIDEILKQPGLTDLDRSKLSIYREFLIANGFPPEVSTRHNLGFDFSTKLNRGMANPGGVSFADFEKEWLERGPRKWLASNIPVEEARIVDDAILEKIRASGVTNVTDDIVRETFENLPKEVKTSSGYQKMLQRYNIVGSYTLGKGLSDVPEIMGDKIRKGIAAKRLGDYPVVQIPSDTVIQDGPAKGLTIAEAIKKRLYSPPDNQHTIITRPEKGNKQISGIYMADPTGKTFAFGKGSAGQRNDIKTSQNDLREGKVVAAKTGELVYDPKTGKTTRVTEQNSKPKKAGVRTTTKKPADRRMIRVGKGKMVVPGADTGLDANGNPLPAVKGGVRDIPFSDAADKTRVKESTIKQSDAIKKNVEATEESTKATNKLTGKITAGVNVFAGLATAASFLGGSMGEMAQKVMPFAILLSTLTMMGPSLKSGFIKLGAFLVANPWVMLVAGVVALVSSIKIMKDRNEKQAKAQSDYIEAISSTTEKMKKVGEVTGKVGASEVMARRREGGTSDRFTTGYDRAGQQFGTNFLDSEIGKSVYDTFANNLAKGGTDAIKKISLELSTYVSDGLMSAEDANSVARSIGINMSDMTIAANISGELRELLGPNGENILTNPLKVRLDIGKEQTKIASDLVEQLKSAGNIELLAEYGAASGAAFTQALEIIQAQRDAQNKMYDDQLRSLETQLASTEDKEKQLQLETQIATLRARQASDDKKFGQSRQDLIKQQLAAFKYTESKGGFLQLNQTQNAFMKAGKEQVRTKYKGTGQEAFINEFLSKSAATGGTKTSQIEVVLNTMVGAGDLTPLAGTKLLNMFGEDGEAKLETLLTTTFASQDPGKVSELINLATNIKGKGGKDIGLKLLTEIGAKGQEGKFDDRLNALTLLQKMDGKEINLAAFLKGDAIGKLDKLVPLLNKVEKQKKIDIKVLQTLQKDPDMPSLKGLIADWERYKNLPEDVKKTVTQTYISVYKTITDENAASMAKAEAEKRGLRGRSAASFINQYSNKDALSALLTREQFAPGKAPNTLPGGSGGGGGGGSRDTTLDNLLNRLKMVRDASINASGGIKELQRITAGSGIAKYSGVINQLMNGDQGGTAKNRGFISFIESMDDATRKTYLTIKNGKSILTTAGKDLAEAFNEQTLGDFNTAQIDTITQVQAQQAAFVKLKAAGIDSATALNMVADAELAIAINSSVEPANKLKDMATKALEAKNAVEGLNLAFKQTMETSKSELEMLKQLPNLVDQMKAIGMNGDQIQAVLNNPDFAREMLNNLKDGKIVSQELADYINSIPERKQVEIDIAMKTPEGMQGLFDKAMGNAMEYFNVLETSIQLKFKKPMKEAEDAVNSAKAAVEAIQDEIDGIQETINQKQRDIEINITRKIEEYQDEINGLQDKIKQQIDKPISILNEESSTLSNDLSIMDRAAEAINEKYDAQVEALTKVADINAEIAAQQRQQLTLADALTQGDISAAAAAAQEMRATQAANQINKTQEALTVAREFEIENQRNAAGLTRAQIEERQYQIGQEIYALEQQRKLIQDQIAFIEETKIAPLNAQKVVAEREIRDLEDKIYVIQQGRLKTAEADLKAAEDKLKAKQDELQAELDAIDAQRDKWIEAQNAIDLAKVKSEAFGKTMEFNQGLVDKLVSAWNSLQSKALTLTVTEVRNVVYTGAGASGTGTGAGSGEGQVPKGATVPKMYGGIIKPMAYGGRVGSDSVPALLTPGEFVMNRGATRAFGPMLEAINSSKYPSMLSGSDFETPTYTSFGGTVIAPSSVSSVNTATTSNSAVYNYNVGITVGGSNASPNDIANAVMMQIRSVESQKIRGQRQ